MFISCKRALTLFKKANTTSSEHTIVFIFFSNYALPQTFLTLVKKQNTLMETSLKSLRSICSGA